MLAGLGEVVLPLALGVFHKLEKLTIKERVAQANYLAKLDVKARKTNKPVIVAFLGLVGSGKSSVSRELAKHIGATVIEGDDIRIELRKLGERFERTRAIAENVALHVVRSGGNAILDSDFVDVKKRASIREKARKEGVRLVFIRTYCDLDVVVGRILTTGYGNKEEDFFVGTPSEWKGSEQSKGAVVKVREMWRRTPNHYRWFKKAGGKWHLRTFPFTFFVEINTTNEKEWRSAVKRCALTLM